VELFTENVDNIQINSLLTIKRTFIDKTIAFVSHQMKIQELEIGIKKPIRGFFIPDWLFLYSQIFVENFN